MMIVDAECKTDRLAGEGEVPAGFLAPALLTVAFVKLYRKKGGSHQEVEIRREHLALG
jgi:hypothetical protein